MRLVMRKSELPDWYVIEREEAPGAYMHSARICDADVEGTAAEMKEIAKAILAAGSVGFKRCAVRVNTATVSLWSPRNSRCPGEVPGDVAIDLAKRMLAELGE